MFEPDAEEHLQNQLSLWGLSPQARVTQVSISENATFRVDDPEREAPLAVRLYRPGYRSEQEIRSEWAWLAAVDRETAVTVAPAVPGSDGDVLQTVSVGAQTFRAAAFTWLPGVEPEQGEQLPQQFTTLGELTAHLHQHGKTWAPPATFQRARWDFAAMFGPQPLWGRWRDAEGRTQSDIDVLARCETALGTALRDYGSDASVFGLVHADLRLANLLVDGDQVSVIDFDDCGFSWFIYDFAAAVSFIETDKAIPALLDAWLAGYARAGALGARDIAMIPTLVMARRLLLTAWLASRAGSDTAETHMTGFSAGTVELAERYLTTGSPFAR
ncbi:MAG: phosphotransferase [Devosiaceae bacterium]|nr:phosphotransferase [Devosiaceae bacterium MH13]